MRTKLMLLSVVAVALGSIACSGGPQPPRPGTPAFYWAAAQQAYRIGDFPQADHSLAEIVTTDNEFAARARPWQLVIASGLARGYSEMADNYEAGAKMNRENPMPFRKQVTTLRSLANSAEMELTEGFHRFLQKDKDPTILLAFAYPAGAVAQPPALRKMAAGMLLQDSERDSLQADMLQRGVLLSLCASTGSPDDPAKTTEIFKQGEVRVPREVFVLAMAKALADGSDLFSSRKLDLPERLKVMCQEALEGLGQIPATKESKALTTKLQGMLKKVRAT